MNKLQAKMIKIIREQRNAINDKLNQEDGIDDIVDEVRRMERLRDVENKLLGMKFDEEIEDNEDDLRDWVELGLGIDGGHHKQYCLIQIADMFGIDHEYYDNGIPP